jgi:hypothetical protein
VAVDDYFEWDHNINILESEAAWALWNDDNMTIFWNETFDQIGTWADMDSLQNAVGKAGPINPIYTYSTDVKYVLPDTGGWDANYDRVINITEQVASPGETLLNTSNGYYLVGDLTNLPFETSYIIGNTSEKFAEAAWYGAMATSPFWAANTGGYYYTNTLFFAPTTINWTEFASNCTVGLEAGYDLDAIYGYDLEVNALSNGFQLYAAAMDFGNNSEAINITVTYDSNGVMESYLFAYGDAVLTEIVRGVTEAPTFPYGTPEDLILAYDYTNESMEWYVSSADPKNYAILTNDSEVLVSPTEWTYGVIVFNITDGLTPGEDHLIKINIADGRNNVATDSVIITVLTDLPTVSNVNLIQNSTTGDLVITYTFSDPDGDADQSDIRWYKDSTLMTAYNDLMTVPASALTANDEWYVEITPSDGTKTNTLVTSDTVTIPEPEPEPTPVIPGYPIIAILGFSVIALVVVVKKRKI